MGKRKKHEEPVSLPNAHLSGREYAEDRPDNCRDCFFWKKSTGSCTRYECFFLRPLRKKIEERFDENGKLILDCRICLQSRPSYFLFIAVEHSSLRRPFFLNLVLRLFLAGFGLRLTTWTVSYP